MKTTIKLLAVFAILVCFAFAVPKTERKVFNVVIDAGHGGKDFGAVHEDFTEKEIVRQVAKKISSLNDDIDVVFYTFNEADEFLSLEDRVKAINRISPDLVLSLHVDANTGATASGMELFISKNPPHDRRSQELADKLSERLTASEYTVKGVKQAPFYILKNVDAPAIQIQLGFLTNDADRAYLTNEDSQSKIASLINDFISEIK